MKKNKLVIEDVEQEIRKLLPEDLVLSKEYSRLTSITLMYITYLDRLLTVALCVHYFGTHIGEKQEEFMNDILPRHIGSKLRMVKKTKILHNDDKKLEYAGKVARKLNLKAINLEKETSEALESMQRLINHRNALFHFSSSNQNTRTIFNIDELTEHLIKATNRLTVYITTDR